NWYSPRFSAYSFALARLNEYEADGIAAQLSSANNTASALVKLPVYASHFEQQFWPKFSEQIHQHPKPVVLPYADMINFIETQPLVDTQVQSAIEFARKEVTNYHDPHPCLSDRLKALEVEDVSFQQTTQCAGKTLLADTLEAIANQLDQHWLVGSQEQWQQEHLNIKHEKDTLAQLQRQTMSNLTQDELWQLAILTEKFNDEEQSLPLYKSYHNQYSDDCKGSFALGRLQLAQFDESGLELLELATKMDEFIEPAGQLAYHYLVTQDKTEQAQYWLDKVHSLEQIYHKAEQERASISAKDTIIKPIINQQDFDYLIAQVKAHKKVKTVWVAQKQLKYFTQSAVFVFAIEGKSGFYLSDNLAQKVVEKVEVQSNHLLFVLSKSNDAKLFKKVVAIGQQV
ncbi:MAG: M48 family metalloprotease, partial [Psychrosphaera sp.]|nr:M48 family metalloprotease [Psychrosphaera sp.]